VPQANTKAVKRNRSIRLEYFGALRQLPLNGRVEGTSRPRSGERSERSLDAPEHGRTILNRSEPLLVPTVTAI
jgi:hypothetical protein